MGNYVNTPIFIIILGGVIFAIALFGCCGAWKESKCLIYTYGSVLVIILIAQVAAAIAAFALQGALKAEITKNMQNGFEENKSVPDSCCKAGHVEGCGKGPVVEEKIYTEGCFDLFSQEFKNNLQIVGIVALAIAFGEMIAIGFAFCLGKRIGRGGAYV